MLYLLRSFGKDGNILKLGYAGNLERRISMYKSHNPLCEVLGTREGDLLEEFKFHLYLHALGYGVVMNEWYEDREEIVSLFNDPQAVDKIDGYIWENREIVIKIGSCQNQVMVYETLSKKFGFDTSKDNLSEIKRNRTDLDYYTDFVAMSSSAILIGDDTPKELIAFIEEFNSLSFFTDRMKVLCLLDKEIVDRNRDYLVKAFPKSEYMLYYETLGPKKCKALLYQKNNLDQEYNSKVLKQNDNFIDKIYSTFEVGKRYTKQYIKEELGKIYTEFGKEKITPKATDLLEWFQIGECMITNKETKKRDMAFEILKKL